MPLLRFDILEGRTDDEIGQILDAAHAARWRPSACRSATNFRWSTSTNPVA